MTLEYKLLAWLVCAVALLAGLFGYGRYQYGKGAEATKQVYEVALTNQKLKAATTLAVETSKVKTAEDALNALRNIQEIKDDEHKKITLRLTDQLRIAAGAAKRLRDPNAGRGGCGSSAPGQAAPGANGSATDGADAGGLLSAELTQLLQSDAQKADDINTAYASCRADAQAVRK